jgi:hypothetical protein
MSNSNARPFAMLILFIGFIGSGISLSALLAGNHILSLQVCGGSIAVGVIVLVIGAIMLGRTRT